MRTTQARTQVLKLPYPDFPLKPHATGQWYKSIWNPRLKKSEQFYFGTWADDPKGERAMSDPVRGWLARRDAIRSGLDRTLKRAAGDVLTVGGLIEEFMDVQHAKLLEGDLADETFQDYDIELTNLFKWCNLSQAIAAEMKPEHFGAYYRHLITSRKLGSHRLATVIRYVRAMFNWGAKNGRIPRLVYGTEFVPPNTDPDTIAAKRMRRGEDDIDDPIFEPAQIAWLLRRATPLFRAMILLTLNCGIGPKDLGRLRWKHLDLQKRMLRMRRGKNGRRREAYLWKKTVRALERVRKLKRNRLAIEQEGAEALVFLTRRGRAVVRTERKMASGSVVSIKKSNAIATTFPRWIHQAKAEGIISKQTKLTYYHLRHTARTYADNCKDLNAARRMMGHSMIGSDKRYIRQPFKVERLKRVAMAIYKDCFPKTIDEAARNNSKK